MNLLKQHFRFQFFICLILVFIYSCQSSQTGDVARNTRELSLADSLNHFNPKAADSIYRRILSDSTEGNRVNYVNALLGLSTIYSNQSNFNRAGELLNCADEMARSMHDTILILNYLVASGNMNLDLGDHSKSEDFYSKGLTLARINKNIHFQNRFLLGRGIVQLDIGNYPTAVKAFTECAKIAGSHNDNENQALALENLSMTLKLTGEYREAIKYSNQTLEIRKRLNQAREYALGLQNLGILYRNLKKVIQRCRFINRLIKFCLI